MQLLSHLSHAPLDFYFAKNADNFAVEEVPLYAFSGAGEHLILKIRKKNLTTQEMLNLLSENLGLKRAEIGYAGLKDKAAMTSQFISLPKKCAPKIERLNLANIKILEATYHENKLKIGHLKGNKFFVRVKKLDALNAQKMRSVCGIIADLGLPNYFGNQRFGKSGENFEEGRKIAHKTLKIRDKKTAQFLLSAYQSHLFNAWLSVRVKLSKIVGEFGANDALLALRSDEMLRDLALDLGAIRALKNQPHFFKILKGDVCAHYPHGRLFLAEDSQREGGESGGEKSGESCGGEGVESAESNADFLRESALRFNAQNIAPTGLLCGKKAPRAKDLAATIEEKFIDEHLNSEVGQRRFAWVFPKNLEFSYKKEVANGELHFFLPRGSYATILLQTLANRDLEGLLDG